MNTTDKISFIGAIIAFLLLVWEVYKYIDERRGKIKVHSRTSMQVPMSADFRVLREGAREVISVLITNVGHHKRLIRKPTIITEEKVRDQNRFSLAINFADPTKFPFSLDAGEELDYQIDKSSMDEEFKQKGSGKIRFEISDTHGGVYRSKWLQL